MDTWADTEPMPEHNTDDIDPVRAPGEIRQSEDKIRYYSKDGILYAYRDNDCHVVVSRGDDPNQNWTKTVPAERDAVLAGEHLWTIPDNWEHRVNISGTGNSSYQIYHVPESGVDVLVSAPNKNHLVDAWYGVKQVGELTVTYADEISWSGLSDSIEDLRERGDAREEVVDVLGKLYRRRRSFEKMFVEEVNQYAKDAVFSGSQEPIPISEWTTDPWMDTFDVSDLVQEILGIDDMMLNDVMRVLDESHIFPSYPSVRVDVEEGVDVPDGYEIRALVEAGASGAETIDCLITEHFDVMTQSEWADVRGKTQSAVSKNVTKAKKRLSDT